MVLEQSGQGDYTLEKCECLTAEITRLSAQCERLQGEKADLSMLLEPLSLEVGELREQLDAERASKREVEGVVQRLEEELRILAEQRIMAENEMLLVQDGALAKLQEVAECSEEVLGALDLDSKKIEDVVQQLLLERAQREEDARQERGQREVTEHALAVAMEEMRRLEEELAMLEERHQHQDRALAEQRKAADARCAALEAENIGLLTRLELDRVGSAGARLRGEQCQESEAREPAAEGKEEAAVEEAAAVVEKGGALEEVAKAILAEVEREREQVQLAKDEVQLEREEVELAREEVVLEREEVERERKEIGREKARLAAQLQPQQAGGRSEHAALAAEEEMRRQVERLAALESEKADAEGARARERALREAAERRLALAVEQRKRCEDEQVRIPNSKLCTLLSARRCCRPAKQRARGTS